MDESKRLTVIENSVLIEKHTAEVLCVMLDIDFEKSRALGHKSTLSFKQKVDLLTDIKLLDKDAIPKFQAFTEIRNQFAHNYYVTDFSTCFQNLESTENFLRKQYKELLLNDQERESQLTVLYTALNVDIQEYTIQLLKKIEELGYNLGHQEGRLEAAESFVKYINNYSEQDPSFKTMMKVVVEGWIEEREKNRNDEGGPVPSTPARILLTRMLNK